MKVKSAQQLWVRRWISMLWHVMSATGNGYKRHSLRRTGRGDDRREDKLNGAVAGVPKCFRQHSERYGAGVNALIRDHKKFPAQTLNHWRDRTA